jgi:16S rRNA (guanine527-N7)-methyltransferase
VHNLTGTRDRAELIDRHLVESLALKHFIVGTSAADIGSGGGLPGVPLAIALPDVSFTLIESRRKRVSFLRHVASSLPLPNVRISHGRAESLDLTPFSTVLARAVAAPAELLAIALPLVAPGGRLVLLTSADRGREIVAGAPDFTQIAASSDLPELKSRIVVLERTLS